MTRPNEDVGGYMREDTMARKTVKNTLSGIEQLPNNKPVVYKYLTPSGNNNYTGTAQRGRVHERLKEHLPGQKDYAPGAKIQIQQHRSIAEARRQEKTIITRSKPKHNKQV